MPDLATPFEAEIVHNLPDDICAVIGRVMVTYAKVEHKLTSCAALILQLNKTEARLALRAPRLADRLDMVLDLFAIKDIFPAVDEPALRDVMTRASSGRDLLAHSLWLKHPETDQLYLRLTRRHWPKELADGEKIKREIYPQSIPYGIEDCQKVLETVHQALVGADALGGHLDRALQAFPERFRSPLPNQNPLGSRTLQGKRLPP